MTGPADPFDLERFVQAQDLGGTFDQALAELHRGPDLIRHAPADLLPALYQGFPMAIPEARTSARFSTPLAAMLYCAACTDDLLTSVASTLPNSGASAIVKLPLPQ